MATCWPTMILHRCLLCLFAVLSTLLARASGSCLSNQFECDNGKCVGDTHRCDDGDDCGDNSDEQNCPSVYLWFGVTIGFIILVYVVLYIILFCIYCCKNMQERRRLASSRVPPDESAPPANRTTATFELRAPLEPYKESDEEPPSSSEAPPAYPATEYPSRSLSFPPPYTSKSSNLESLPTLPNNSTL